jgi:exonuclease III
LIRLLSWNMDNQDLWDAIPTDPGYDVALVQEMRRPDGAGPLELIPERTDPWQTSGWKRRNWRTAIGRLSDEVTLRPHRLVAGHEASIDALEVSRPGTLAVADVLRGDETLFTVASVYGVWESPPGYETPVYSDASAHRLLSDLAGLLTKVHRHRLIVAGDWNILYGYGEDGDPYWRGRYQSVFDRAEAMRLSFVGPQAPNGRQADPWPEELPQDSKNVPTFHHSRATPATAQRQLDYVFASEWIAEKVKVRALNSVEEWGPSDHCRIEIEVDL